MSETKTCAYCRAERPIYEMKQAEITCIRGRQTKTGGYRKAVVKEKHWYCKDKPCHGYDQMAHD